VPLIRLPREIVVSPALLLIVAGGILFIGASGLIAARMSAARARREHLAALNATAAADSTTHWYAGQLQLASRLALQGQVQLAGALRDRHVQAVTITSLRLEADSLRREHAKAPVVTVGSFDAADTLDARDSAGVRVVAAVHGDTARTTWRWDLEREAAAFDVSMGCKRDTAVAQVQGPRWARVSIVRAQQDAAICNPPPRWNPLSLRAPSLPLLAAAGLLGWLLGR
jgi:hypothetical protein